MARSVARRVAGLLVAALVAMLHAPAGAQPESLDRLEETRSDLDVARSSLDELNRRLDAAQRALAEVDARLAGATSGLHDLEGRLRHAEQRQAAAAEEARQAGEQVAEADAALAETVAAWKARRAEFEDRVAAAYKHGSAWGVSLLTESFFEARDLHELAVNVRTVQAIMDQDLHAMRRARQLALDAVQARREVTDLRRAALDTQREADAARDAVAGLVEQQRAVIASIEEQRAKRQQILDEVAGDRQQMVTLISRLTQKAARLTSRLNADLAAAATGAFDGPMPDWSARLPQPGRQWAPPITGAAGRAGISPELFAALVWAESYFQPGAVSHAGAIGLSQLMPATASALGVDPWDPIENLVGGSRYLRMQIDRFEEIDLALAAYNAGPGAVERAGRRVPDNVETQMYVLRVLEYWERILGV